MQAGSQKRPKKGRTQQNNMERNRLVEELDALDTTPDPLSLLNFSLPEVQRGPRQTPKPKKSTTPYQKERFMQANYKFAVCPSIYDSIVDSYSRTRRCFDGTIENVDKILDYKDISQVVFTVNKWPHQCIICLGAPQCPKISACGHVFCWTCIIQYFASKIEAPDIPSILKQRCACPVCQSNLHLEDFRPVQLVFQEKTATQKTVKFNLVMREKTSTVVCLSSEEASFHRTIPVSSVQSRVNFVPLSFPSLGSVHASVNRVNVAFAEDMERIWAAEDKELEAIIKESLSSQDPALPTMLLAQDIHKGQKLLFLENENRYVHKHPALSLPSSTPLSGSGNDLVFFYQENSGAHVFLHPISVRWLLKEYQTQENLPKLIEADVILFEDEITQDEASRKRYRFLGHLPICCNFQFCLVNVGALLSPANLAGFKQEVNALKQQIHKHSKERQQHEFHQQKQMQEKYLKESTVSQAILYEKYANPETVSRDANNFPSLPASSPAGSGMTGNHPNYHGKNQGWNNYIGTSHLIESMIWESQPVLKRPEAFPSLSPSPAPAAVAPAPLPAQQKAPPAVWGNTQHLKDAGRAKPPQNQQRNNHPFILNFDYKFRS